MDTNAGESEKVPPVKKFGTLGLIAIGFVTFCRCFKHIMILMTKTHFVRIWHFTPVFYERMHFLNADKVESQSATRVKA
jgi:hypothetical protein